MRGVTAATASIAHRGASGHAPENTLAAIALAVEMRCDLVEVDVQRTRDGELVLVHDLDLTRTTDIARRLPRLAGCRVGDLTLAELRGLDAGSWFSPAYAGEQVPTLAEAVDLLQHSDTGLLLELKKPALHPGVEADVAATLRRFPGFRAAASDGRLVVQSFDHGVVRRFADLEPGVPAGLLGRPPVRRLPRLARWASHVNPRHRAASASYVAAVHDAGMDCFVWTVDRPADMARSLDLGVDGVITNHPDRLERTLLSDLVPAA